MLKIFYLFAVYLTVVYALQKKAEITIGKIQKIKNYPGVSVKENDGKTEITWNEPVSEKVNPLRATFSIRFTSLRKSEKTEIDNLCGSERKGSLEESVQLFILKIIADTDKCPILGAKATFSVPATFPYMRNDNKLCGPFRSEMKVFRKIDGSNSQPLIMGTFQGNITGCQ